jgi:hypothetical protein
MGFSQASELVMNLITNEIKLNLCFARGRSNKSLASAKFHVLISPTARFCPPWNALRAGPTTKRL